MGTGSSAIPGFGGINWQNSRTSSPSSPGTRQVLARWDPPEPFTAANYARCLAAFLDSIGVERPHLLGLSWGGILAQEFFRLYPEPVRSLVLADTYAGWKGSLPQPVYEERLATCLVDRGSCWLALLAAAGILVACFRAVDAPWLLDLVLAPMLLVGGAFVAFAVFQLALMLWHALRRRLAAAAPLSNPPPAS